MCFWDATDLEEEFVFTDSLSEDLIVEAISESADLRQIQLALAVQLPGTQPGSATQPSDQAAQTNWTARDCFGKSAAICRRR